MLALTSASSKVSLMQSLEGVFTVYASGHSVHRTHCNFQSSRAAPLLMRTLSEGISLTTLIIYSPPSPFSGSEDLFYPSLVKSTHNKSYRFLALLPSSTLQHTQHNVMVWRFSNLLVLLSVGCVALLWSDSGSSGRYQAGRIGEKAAL
jgi:hypothetical protein